MKPGEKINNCVIIDVNNESKKAVICSELPMYWNQSLKYADGANFKKAQKDLAKFKDNGLSGWRLPTQKELQLMFKLKKNIKTFSSGFHMSCELDGENKIFGTALDTGHQSSTSISNGCYVHPVLEVEL
jgi:hypothetical protein